MKSSASLSKIMSGMIKAGRDLISFFIRQWNMLIRAARKIDAELNSLKGSWKREDSILVLHLICWRDSHPGMYSRSTTSEATKRRATVSLPRRAA